MGKKFNNIKPGTICALVHNDSLIFRITHINESGFPFAKHSLFCYSTWDEFQLDKKPVCMAYTTEYKEATNFVEGVTYYYYNHENTVYLNIIIIP